MRNVVVMGLAPLGCAPYYLWLYESENGECVETINDMIVEFNFAMRYMVEELNHELVGANVIFCDAFEGSMDIMKNSDRYGEKNPHHSVFILFKKRTRLIRDLWFNLQDSM